MFFTKSLPNQTHRVLLMEQGDHNYNTRYHIKDIGFYPCLSEDYNHHCTNWTIV